MVFNDVCNQPLLPSGITLQEIMANVTERIQSETLGPLLQVSPLGTARGVPRNRGLGRPPHTSL